MGFKRDTGKTVVGMSAQALMPQPASDETRAPKSNARYRSFAERYVVERARTFPIGRENEAAWEAALQAKTIYKMIQRIGQSKELGMDE